MPTPLQTSADVAQDYATTKFIIEQLLLGKATASLARVVSCTNDGGLTAQGRVTIQVLVNQMAGDGTGVPHGEIVDVPYSRVSGGRNAIILDPQAGDLGCVVFASRDISLVKKNRAQANPGSYRAFSMSDAMYLGSVLPPAELPDQYVRFASDGLELVSPTRVRIQAPAIELDGPVTMSSTMDADGDVTGAGISLQNHTHGGVQSGGSNTAPPNP